MSIPLDKIIDYRDNVYEMTSVAILDAQYLALKAVKTGDRSAEKLVSKALRETLNNEVEYMRQED